MQGLLPPSPNRITKIEIKKGKRSQRYQITYEDGFQLLSFYLPLVNELMEAGVELIAPQYCHPCRTITSHFYYHHSDKVNCLYCFNELEANDTRPFAKVLQFPERK